MRICSTDFPKGTFPDFFFTIIARLGNDDNKMNNDGGGDTCERLRINHEEEGRGGGSGGGGAVVCFCELALYVTIYKYIIIHLGRGKRGGGKNRIKQIESLASKGKIHWVHGLIVSERLEVVEYTYSKTWEIK